MASFRPPMTDFSAGELTPRLAGRVDSPVYYKGCQELTNFVPRPLGGIAKRGGFTYIGETLASASGRLIPWTPIAGVNILVELTAGHIRFWCNDVLVVDSGTPGTTVDITGPNFTLAEIPKVKYVQIKDALILVHPSHAPYQIAYSTHTLDGSILHLTLSVGTPSFIYGIIEWEAPAEVPWNASDLWDKLAQWMTLDKRYSAPAATTFNSKTLTYVTRRSNSLLLEGDDIGGTGTDTLTLTQTATYSYAGTIAIDYKLFAASGEYPASCTVKNGRLYLAGSTNEPNVVYASKPLDFFNFTIFEVIEYEKTSVNDNPYSFTATTVSGSATITGLSVVDINKLRIGNGITGSGIPSSTTVVSVGTSSAVLSKNATASATVTLAGNWTNPDIPEYTHSLETTQQIGPGSAMKLVLATEENEAIQWLAAGQDIIMGTASSEFGMAGASNATNASVALTGRCGSKDIQARNVQGQVFFVQGSGTIMRAWTPDGSSPAINRYADHILAAGVVAFDYSSDPETALWVVCADGYLYRCGLEGEIPSWARYKTVTGDAFESVAVVQSSLGDMVYAIVKRVIGGTTRRYIEKLTFNEDLLYTDRQYLDCSVKATSASPFRTITGLERFNGTDVVFYAGASEATMVQGTARVTAGTMPATTFPAGTLCAYVGLSYTATMKTYRIETPETEGIRKMVPAIHFRLYRCGPFTLRWSSDTTKASDLVSPTGIYTGAIKKTRASNQMTDQTIIVESATPWPVGIQTIVPDVEIGQATTGGQ